MTSVLARLPRQHHKKAALAAFIAASTGIPASYQDAVSAKNAYAVQSLTIASKPLDSFDTIAPISGIATDGQFVFIDSGRRLASRNISSHKIVWSMPSTLSNFPEGSNLAADRGMVFTLTRDGQLVARFGQTGFLRWRVAAGLARAVLSSNGSLYTYGQAITRIDEKTGAIKWTLSSPGTSYEKPAVVGQRVVLEESSGGGSISRSALILNSETGQAVVKIASKVPGIFVAPLAVERDELLTTYTSGTSDLSQLAPGYLAARIQRNDMATGRFIRSDDYAPDSSSQQEVAPPAKNLLASNQLIAMNKLDSTFVYKSWQSSVDQHPIRISGLGQPLAVYGDRLMLLSDRALSVVQVDGHVVRVIDEDRVDVGGQYKLVGDSAVIVIKSRTALLYYDLGWPRRRRIVSTECQSISGSISFNNLLVVQCGKSDQSASIVSFPLMSTRK